MADAVLAVTSTEEYTAKIIALQQACLTPLKEDLADWLNKIMNLDDITANNFMNKLDNGVIIFNLAKIISTWCGELQKDQLLLLPQSNSNRLTNLTTATHNKQINICLDFSNNAKIWEDAKSKTFYARDNVCNFIKWSKEFGVNQSVLFESDDLVLHANPRQVVLCLLDVARIACVKYGFTEAPGLVRFEQEIDRELAAESAAAARQAAKAKLHACDQNDNITLHQASLRFGLDHIHDDHLSDHDGGNRQELYRFVNNKDRLNPNNKDYLIDSTGNDGGNIHELAAIKNAKIVVNTTHLSGKNSDNIGQDAEFCNNANRLPSDQQDSANNAGSTGIMQDTLFDVIGGTNGDCDRKIRESIDNGDDVTLLHNTLTIEPDSLTSQYRDDLDNQNINKEANRTGRNSTDPITPSSRNNYHDYPTTPSCIPTLIKRTNSNCSIASNQTMASSDLSSSQSSSCHQKHHVASDLDGKVMRIAKSYYGKKGITRLSEGKYKIADRIVFVRLLKGQHVMVRIGGGWDTLQNFLFRHKSDPSQVIDVDDLLPLDAKLMLEMDGPQLQAKQFTRTTPSTPSSSSTLNLASSVSTTPSSFITSSSQDISNTNPHNNNVNQKISSHRQNMINNTTTSLKSASPGPCFIIHGGHNGLTNIMHNHQNQIYNHHQLSQQHQQQQQQLKHHHNNHHHQLLSTLSDSNSNEQITSTTNTSTTSNHQSLHSTYNENIHDRNTDGNIQMDPVKLIGSNGHPPHLVDYSRRSSNSSQPEQCYGSGSGSSNNSSSSGFGGSSGSNEGNSKIKNHQSNHTQQQLSHDSDYYNHVDTTKCPANETTNITIHTDNDGSTRTNSNKTSTSSSPLTPKLSYESTEGPTSPSTTATSTDMDTGFGCSITSSTTTTGSVNLCNLNNHHYNTTSNNKKSNLSVNNNSSLDKDSSTMRNNLTPISNLKYHKYLKTPTSVKQHQQNQLIFTAKDYLDSRQNLYGDQRSRSTSEDVSAMGAAPNNYQTTYQHNNLRNLINGNSNIQPSESSVLKHGRSQQVLIRRLKAPGSAYSKSTLSLNGGFSGSNANLNSATSHRQIANSNLSSAHMLYGTPIHTSKSSRYPNYLKSSQHITNRAKQAGVPI